MEFIIIYFFCLISIYCIFAYGYISNRVLFRFKYKHYTEIILIGLLFFIFTALLLNFFISLNKYLNTIIFLTGFVILFKYKKNINFISLTKLAVLISLIGYLTFILDQSNRPDAGLYNLPFVSILNNEKIILGSVNLHFRFGHISSLQYLASLFNNFIFGDNGILIPLTIFFAVILVYFYYEYKLCKNIFIKTYSILSIIFILTSMNRYSGFGNDDPAHMLYLVVILNLLKIILNSNSDTTQNFNKLIFYSANTFLIKQFYILILFLPLIIFLKYFKNITLFNRPNIFSLILVMIWLFKNILVSSFVFYPISFTCLKSVSWSPINTFSDPNKVSLESEAWAKSWPDRADKSENFKQYLSNYKWLGTWSKNHLKVVIKKIFPLIFIIFLFITFLYLKISKKELISTNKYLNYTFYIHIIFFLIWFLKFPTYRYGAAYLGVTFILFSLITINKFNIKYDFLKFFNIILIGLIIIISLKNFGRVYKNINSTYLDYPWPKKNSFTDSNLRNDNKPVLIDNEIIYYEASPYSLCMYSKSPCTHFRDLDINRKLTFGKYKIYYFNNK